MKEALKRNRTIKLLLFIFFMLNAGIAWSQCNVTIFSSYDSLGDPICPGQEVFLNAVTDSTQYPIDYKWSTDTTILDSNTISVYPTVTTTYTVTITDNNSCTASDIIIIYVNPMPTADAGGDTSTCKSMDIILTASGGTEYSWSTGDTTASITVSPATDTSFIVTVTENICLNSDEDTIFVYVYPPPTANAGLDQTICNWDTITLTASGGETYLWNTQDTTEYINVYPDVTTTYTVTVTDINGCTDYDEIVVATTYNCWILLGGQVFADLFPIDYGKAYLYRSDIETEPLDSFIIDTLGYFYFFNIMEAYYKVKVILTENSIHYGEYSPTFFGNVPDWGNATSIYLQSNKYDADIIMLPNNSINDNHLKSSIISDLYPNPVDQELHIDINLLKPEKLAFIVYDIVGQKISEQISDFPSGKHTIILPVNTLPQGVYSLNITSPEENLMYNRKFVRLYH